MRRRAAVLTRFSVAVLASAVLAWAAGCSRPGSERLQGHWHGVRAESAGGDAPSAANAFAAETNIEVVGETLTLATPTETQSGRYRIVSEDDKSVTVTTEKDGPDSPQTFFFEGSSMMKWAAAPGKSLIFMKQ